MTMRVNLENTDQQRTVRVIVRRKSATLTGAMEVSPLETKEILPGGIDYVYLHSGQDCILQEVQPENQFLTVRGSGYRLRA